MKRISNYGRLLDISCFFALLAISGLVFTGKGVVSKTIQVPRVEVPRNSILLQDIPKNHDILFFDKASKQLKSKHSQARDFSDEKALSLSSIFDSVYAVSQSPDKKKLAIEAGNGEETEVWIVDVSAKSNPKVTRLVATGNGRFLNWHPDSQRVLYVPNRNGLADWGLWIVEVNSGDHKQVAIPEIAAPEGIVGAAVQPGTDSIAVALTKGIGFGSSIWKVEANGATSKVFENISAVASNLVWSKNGKYLAAVNLEDSATPFTVAELIVYDDSANVVLPLGLIDGGHGQSVVFDADSTKVFAVKRTNLDDDDANYDASKLKSVIVATDLLSKEMEKVDSELGMDTNVDLSLSPSGEIMFASSSSDGDSAIQILNKEQNGKLKLKVIRGKHGAIRFPIQLSDE